jgi:hypothetical protein
LIDPISVDVASGQSGYQDTRKFWTSHTNPKVQYCTMKLCQTVSSGGDGTNNHAHAKQGAPRPPPTIWVCDLWLTLLWSNRKEIRLRFEIKRLLTAQYERSIRRKFLVGQADVRQV